MHYDVFNGDADGIISLLQLRLVNPIASQLFTGVKRDISLLEKLDLSSEDSLTVLDISMAKNIEGLLSALSLGVDVFYADHHQSGEIPAHAALDAHIDLDANTCTALIIDDLLEGKYHLWAITAAYGDNLIEVADQLARVQGLSDQQNEQLKELGTLINYNGYGAKVEDLHYHPADLYQALLKYRSPFDAIDDAHSPFYQLQQAYRDDMAQALSINATYRSEVFGLFVLPNNAASRRISGVYGNLLANQAPNSAHAVLSENTDGTYTVSLRAPLNNKQGAVDICSQFPTGGGRAAAAGINALTQDDVNRFIQTVEQYYR